MEAGLFTLRFVITGLSTKKAAEVCKTSEKTYKKWESTRIYPVDALDRIRACAKACEADQPENKLSIREEKVLAIARKELMQSFEDNTAKKVINFPNE